MLTQKVCLLNVKGMLDEQGEIVIRDNIDKANKDLEKKLIEYINNSRRKSANSWKNPYITKIIRQQAFYEIYLPGIVELIRLTKKYWYYVKYYSSLSEEERIKYVNQRKNKPITYSDFSKEVSRLKEQEYSGPNNVVYQGLFNRLYTKY